MAQLVIFGHATRGKEVIEILEMLGGENPYAISTAAEGLLYRISNYDNRIVACSPTDTFVVFTLEHFLEKYPYKVGDKVNAPCKGCVKTITSMKWDTYSNTVIYKLNNMEYTNIDQLKVVNDLQPYKEETIEEKIQAYEVTEEICANEIAIEFDPSKYEMVKKENGYYVVKKQPQYPKTYEECCKVLDIDPWDNDVQGYKNYLILSFHQLLICRDAYWKIAGEQMGLEKPWESNPSNEEQHRYAIYNYEGTIVKNDFWLTGVNAILVFPTEEMRDAFLENFKELIEECKELL